MTKVKSLPRLLIMHRSINKNPIHLTTQSLLNTLQTVFPCAAYLKKNFGTCKIIRILFSTIFFRDPSFAVRVI